MEVVIFVFAVILAPIILAFLEARGDAQRISHGFPIDHAASAALRLAILVPLALGATWPPRWLVVAGVGLSLSIFWLSFDIMLNSMRGLPLTYVGKASITDQLLSHLTPKGRIGLKVGLIVTFLVILLLA